MEQTVFFFHVRNRIGSWLEDEGYVNALHPLEVAENRLLATDYTVAYFFDKETKSIIASRSVRHPHDRFVKKTGRDNAEERVTGKTPHTYHPYFDAIITTEDLLENQGLLSLLAAFKPESSEALSDFISELSSDFENLSGSLIVNSLEEHFDAMTAKHGPRMGLGGGTFVKLPVEFIPDFAEEAQ